MFLSQLPFFLLFLKFPAENSSDMYILGFVFLFIGLSLLLYAVIQLLGTSESKHIQNAVKTSDSEKIQKSFTSSQQSIPSIKKMEEWHPEKKSNIQMTNSFEQSEKKIKKEIHKPKTFSYPMPKITRTSDKQVSVSPTLKKEDLNHLTLFITGYLYYDPSRSTYIILEKQDKTPSDYLSHLIRLGNATLEWNSNQFVFDSSEKKIILPYDELTEIRFIEDCALFVGEKSIPYYFFFSSYIQELKEFLKKLSDFHK